MKQYVWLIILIFFGIKISATDFVLNTQLEKKLKKIDQKETLEKKPFQFDVLRKLEIIGLKTIDEISVKNEISVFIGDKLDPFTINRNIKRIQAMGYFKDVSSKLSNFEGGKKWEIYIKENPIITAIEVTGNIQVTSKDVINSITTKPGDLFNFVTTRKDIELVEKKYSTEGFLFTKVTNVDLPTEKSGILRFHILESQLSSVTVSGNTKTKDYVILREMDINKGDPVSEKEIKKNLRRIFNLNYFSEVLPDIQPEKAEKNAYNLSINVKEKSTDSINLGGGWGQQSGGFFYTDLNINNLFGTGQLVALRGQWGNRTQTYQFKYHNPWMFGKRKSLTYRLWNTRGNFGFNNLLSSGYRPEKRIGTDLSIGLPHSYNLRSNHTVRFEKVDIEQSSLSNEKTYSIQSYRYRISYDTRDIIFNPLNGVYYTASIENSFKFRSDSMLFTKYDISLANFFQTQENQTLATRINLGLIRGDTEETEYYFVGGPNTVRGYEEYPNSFGFGKAQFLANAEYRFMLSDIFQFLLFIDYGWASSLGRDIMLGKIGKGFGLRINSPLGPIRIDYGIDEKGAGRTHFNIGHVF